MKQILVGKIHDITDFASKDASRYVLQSVHYNKEAQCVEATDGRILMRVPVSEVDGEFPPVKTTSNAEPIDCIIPIAPFKKALANIPKATHLPILNNAKLDSNGSITLTTTDLDTEQTVTCKPVDANYPRCEQVIPSRPGTLKIRLGANILKKVVDYALKHANDSEQTITFEFIDNMSATRFTIPINTVNGNTVASGVFMPCKPTA